MPLFFDSTMILLLPAILLAMFAQYKIKNTFAVFSKVASRSGLTGAQVARDMLQNSNITDVSVELTQGVLTDHYDPRSRKLRLSPQVYHSSSIAALGVAAHEVGHVMQHENSYLFFNIRNAIVPIANIGSRLAFPLFLLGIVLSMPSLVEIGVFAFGAAVLFQLITLPVEFNASSRAIESLEVGGYLQVTEIPSAKKVLNAAALTYIAATLMAVMQLLRLLLLSGMLGRRK